VLASLSALGVLAVIALVASLLIAAQEPTQTTVPNVLGKAEADARDALAQAGLGELTIGAPQFGTDCQKDTVYSQQPQGNIKVNKNTPVTIRMCGGPAEVAVPERLVGLQYEEVKTTLENVGLKVKQELVNSEKPEGQVLKVDPPSGTKVPEKETITVQVSKGNKVPVPNVVDLSEERARQELERAGFKVRVVDGERVDPASAGIVTDQSPNADTLQVRNSTVTITVSRPRDDQPTGTPDPDDSGSPTPGPGQDGILS
jgi:serine/threonine-protein kinase